MEWLACVAHRAFLVASSLPALLQVSCFDPPAPLAVDAVQIRLRHVVTTRKADVPRQVLVFAWPPARHQLSALQCLWMLSREVATVVAAREGIVAGRRPRVWIRRCCHRCEPQWKQSYGIC